MAICSCAWANPFAQAVIHEVSLQEFDDVTLDVRRIIGASEFNSSRQITPSQTVALTARIIEANLPQAESIQNHAEAILLRVVQYLRIIIRLS